MKSIFWNFFGALSYQARFGKGGLILLLFFSLMACSNSSTLKWEESVVLPDGRIVLLKREQRFDEDDYVGAHSFEFENPATKQSVTWQSDGFFMLVALFLASDVPHILVRPTFSSDTERAGCPYPVVLIYKFEGASWKQIPYASSPLREISNNTTLDPKVDRDYIKARNFKLRPGEIRVRNSLVEAQYYGLNLNKFPTQVFQCPNQKRVDLH